MSDIHISKFFQTRADNLRIFCSNVVPTVNPALVVASGDLTDGYQTSGIFRAQSAQQATEWQTYQSILAQYGYANTSFWLDLRGNHDGMGTAQSRQNDYYATYAVQGNQRNHYIHDLNATNGPGYFRFGAVDLVNVPGLVAPFMVFGIEQPNLAAFASGLTSTQKISPWARMPRPRSRRLSHMSRRGGPGGST